ncbi:MAG: radical SAM protein [Candidatus Delongbacteria bacterium]|nr:radical SAM protein [Candidatus Delongbacteria bacterium]MBN2833817.1 radical SAM protein [Candidatus Delongbacteria bacterium]
MTVKDKLISFLTKNDLGNEALYQIKKMLKRTSSPDKYFPNEVTLEITSLCNYKCIHCAPQNPKFSNEVKKKGNMDFDLFLRLMDEVDKYGKRNLAVHKDGEPLIYPKILDVLKRLKKNVDHHVYLTTNGVFLSEEVSNTILENRVDTINFSLGAYSPDIYKKIRGGELQLVLKNIEYFLKRSKHFNYNPRIIAQIIRLSDFPEMEKEIYNFKTFWEEKGLEVQIWDELNWGEDKLNRGKYRYPCFSLFNSIFVNSSGNVSPCCIDWKESLVVGKTSEYSLKEIWDGQKLKQIRKIHLENKEDLLPMCKNCNFWRWYQKTDKYFT